MIVLPEAEALRRLTVDLAFDAVRRALVAAADGSGAVFPVVAGKGLNDGEIFAVKSGAAVQGRVVGLKVGAYWPGNEARGLACHGSSILLLDPDTGRLMAVVEADRLNGPRTAAADAVAASVLARPGSATLTIIGAGRQAVHEATALAAILPLKRVLIVSRSPERGAALRARLAENLGIEVETTDTERGCREADILVTVTSSRSPLFDAGWIKPGTHVASMGSDQVGKQELPRELLRRARLFCDLPSQSVVIGEFQHIRAELQSRELTIMSLGAVLIGREEGRRSDAEITVFDSSGIALQDLFVAASLLQANGPGPAAERSS